MDAKGLRQWFRDLFGSRVVSLLENQIVQMRVDFESRLADKERQLAEYRSELSLLRAKIMTMEQVVMPLQSKAGADFVAQSKPKQPSFAAWMEVPFVDAPKTRWQMYQEKYDGKVNFDGTIEESGESLNNVKPTGE